MPAGSSVGMFQNVIILFTLGIVFGKITTILFLVCGGLTLPQDYVNTLNMFGLAFQAFFILMAVALIFNHLVEANNEGGGRV